MHASAHAPRDLISPVAQVDAHELFQRMLRYREAPPHARQGLAGLEEKEENEERGERPTHPLLLFFVLVAVPLGGIGYAFLAYHLAIPISTRLHDFVLSGLKLLWAASTRTRQPCTRSNPRIPGRTCRRSQSRRLLTNTRHGDSVRKMWHRWR